MWQKTIDPATEKSKLYPDVTGVANLVGSDRLHARIQYNTSFSPFWAINCWKCSTILSRLAIKALISSLLR
jgi:hypothetical protein